MSRLVRNSAQCTACGDHLESKRRHDFVLCSCGNLFIDGGLDYQRIGFTDSGFVNTSLYEEEA